MRAAFIVAPRKFEIREVPTPKITDGEMLVKIEACGVCSSDMSGYKDSWGAEMKAANPFPRRAGHEPAGTVVEVGKLVKALKSGIYPMEKLVTHKYKLEDIGQAFEANLGAAPGYIKGVVMPFMS